MDTTLELGGLSADAYLKSCASRTVLNALADKWTCLLVDALRHEPVRFGALRRRLDGISQKSLTQTLRTMERDGIVIRTHYPTIPPRVEYELSALGHSVVTLMSGIKGWAEEHVDEIVTARKRYDACLDEEAQPVPSPLR